MKQRALFCLLFCALLACRTDPADRFADDAASLAAGRELFDRQCASCHNFTARGIGPNLSGVTAAADRAWLTSFITNAPEMIDGGDPRAVALFEEYGQYMPPFDHLPEEEVDYLIAYLHASSDTVRTAKRADGLADPIPTPIPVADFSLAMEEVMAFPKLGEGAPHARINEMTTLRAPTGDRDFMLDLRGVLYEITADGEWDTPRVFFDARPLLPAMIVTPGLATGLGSVAFHPNYAANGLMYTTHSEAFGSAPADFPLPDSLRGRLQWVLTEWREKTPRELLRVDMITHVHGFQQLTFNPRARPGDDDFGMLYLCIGDGAATEHGEPYVAAGNGNIWSSVIRIDPTGTDGPNGQYGIPPDNPFVGRPDALPEIWAYGFRNPHRIYWTSGPEPKMLISDIGQANVEEVNLGRAGGNYGWPYREGTFAIDTVAGLDVVYPLPPEDADYLYPVIQYDHDEGRSICGGYVYGGDALPALRGKYVFGDILEGTVFYADADRIRQGSQAPVYRIGLEMGGESVDLPSFSENRRADLRLGVDRRGELYLFTKSNGKVYRLSVAG